MKPNVDRVPVPAGELATEQPGPAGSRSPDARFAAAIRRFDEENARDPNTAAFESGTLPYELFYAQRVTEWVLRLCPDASEALLLAARCQHLCRWMIPRTSYEMTRAGYLKWRADLKQFHSKKAAEILAELGYSPAMIERVRSLNLKHDLGRDREVQVLEDALCLVTLQHQLGDLAQKVEPEKMVGILQKTWKKMSPAAREAALALSYPDSERALLAAALSPASDR
ncbi:MAG: DUF4202 domain-containing protein [Verrucomicrobiota bacterium]|nr:DUF4202 domain-containing protein [Verrucomicrobiota bacterium]